MTNRHFWIEMATLAIVAALVITMIVMAIPTLKDSHTDPKVPINEEWYDANLRMGLDSNGYYIIREWDDGTTVKLESLSFSSALNLAMTDLGYHR